MTPSGTLTLDKGRTLAWDEFGDPGAVPVLYFHGTPACRVLGKVVAKSADTANVRIIAPDRPGCGLSTFQPDRRLTDWTQDVATLVDHLGLERYAIIGTSGGGPYALACAAAGDPRLARTAVMAGVGPLDGPGAIARLYDTNRPIMEAAKQGVDAVLPLLQGLTSAENQTAEELAAMAASMSPDDQRVLSEQPEIMADLVAMMTAAAVNGLDGLAYDLWLVTQPWGFDLVSIPGPVDFFGGDHDHNVPVEHLVEQAAAVAKSTLTIWPACGHTSAITKLPSVLRQLAAATT